MNNKKEIIQYFDQYLQECVPLQTIKTRCSESKLNPDLLLESLGNKDLKTLLKVRNI